MRNKVLGLAVAATVGVLGLPGVGVAQLYNFTIQQPTSGLSGPLAFEAATSGTLIGNWDEVKNPAGTRTKAGILGTFGPLENLPVPVSMGVSASGPLNTRTSGMFQLELNPGAGTLSMQGLSSNFLASGPTQIPLTLELLYESFRTRQPTSTYIGGIPFSLPLGEATLSALSVQQVGLAQGILTPTGPGTYDFAISPVVLLTAELSVMGMPLSIPGLPIALPFGGQLSMQGTTAVLSSVQPLEFATGFEPNLALPQFPFELPTILPPGEVSQLLMDLVLTDISASFDGTLAVHANGVLVPAPASAAVLLAMGVGVRRRRG